MKLVLSMQTAAPYSLRRTVFSHGWWSLPPYRWTEPQGRLSHVSELADGTVYAVQIEQPADSESELLAVLHSRRPFGTRTQLEIELRLRKALALDWDLDDFLARCRDHRDFDWVARARAGRLLTSPCVYEDLVKMLLTTNCSWGATTRMTRALVDSLGSPAPLGMRAFPTAAAMARQPESFYRTRIRAGYRAPHLVELSRRVASGDLDPYSLRNPERTTEDIAATLSALPGFGPYATEGMLRLLGRTEPLALDSWCRAKYRRLYPSRKCTDRAIARRYAGFGPHRGLALWMDLTRDWFTSDRPNASCLGFQAD